MLNRKCPVRDTMLVESVATHMSHGLPAAFHVSGSVPRETDKKTFYRHFVSARQ
ncbi:MAG: hypothetical protein LBK94_13035 [Prevotellaceae bacterium]|nr:hypothetical protein [Prevotellaceae bacterium]